MNFTQAMAEARKRWGSQAIVKSSITHKANGSEGEEEEIDLVREVGILETKYAGKDDSYSWQQIVILGQGATWEDAFNEAETHATYARRRRLRAVRAKTAPLDIL